MNSHYASSHYASSHFLSSHYGRDVVTIEPTGPTLVSAVFGILQELGFSGYSYEGALSVLSRMSGQPLQDGAFSYADLLGAQAAILKNLQYEGDATLDAAIDQNLIDGLKALNDEGSGSFADPIDQGVVDKTSALDDDEFSTKGELIAGKPDNSGILG